MVNLGGGEHKLHLIILLYFVFNMKVEALNLIKLSGLCELAFFALNVSHA